MHRLIATLLGLALIAGSADVSALHIHAYIEHDHPEHHHGLAAHEHQATRAHSEDDTVHLEGCDPSQHTISLVFVCAAPPQAQAVDAEFVTPAIAAPELHLHPAVDITDVRVHGPPLSAQASPRAPPLIFPA